jgi:outer membrane biosynthesis protein TonB
MMMNKKLAVMLTLAAFGLAQVAPVAAQTSPNAPAQTTPKKSTTPKKKATPKKSTAPKKKTTKTSKPKTSSLASPQVFG